LWQLLVIFDSLLGGTYILSDLLIDYWHYDYNNFYNANDQEIKKINK